MEIISFPCGHCQHVLKIGADKAGRRARCPKCKQVLVIPAQSAGAGGFADDEEENVYALLDDPNAPPPIDFAGEKKVEEEDEDDEEKQERDRVRRQERIKSLRSLRKAPVDPGAWQAARQGLLLVGFGVLIWLAAFVCQKLVVAGGMLSPPEYSQLASGTLVDPDEEAQAFYAPTLYRAHFGIGMVGGSRLFVLWWFLYVVSYLFVLLHLAVSGMGCLRCIGAPADRGMKGIALAGVIACGVIFLITFFLKLLPTVGITSYTLLPLIAPEVPMCALNMNRSEPIHVALSTAPFFETLLALFLRLAVYMEPLLICVFLHAAAKSLHEEVLQTKTHAMIRLALGVAFIDMAFLLVSCAGTSGVLIGILRVAYVLYCAFYLWLLIWIALVCFEARRRIERMLRFI